MTTFKEQIICAGLTRKGKIHGLSDKKISEIESSQNIILPSIYRGFLLDCGGEAGQFQDDADFFYPSLKRLKNELHAMLIEENINFNLPDNAFVFGAYQGYQYHYFLCDGKSDPAVYEITDGGREPKIIADSFTHYMKITIESYKSILDEKTLV